MLFTVPLNIWMQQNEWRKRKWLRLVTGSVLIRRYLTPYVLSRLFLNFEVLRMLFLLLPDAFICTWSGSFPYSGWNIAFGDIFVLVAETVFHENFASILLPSTIVGKQSLLFRSNTNSLLSTRFSDIPNITLLSLEMAPKMIWHGLTLVSPVGLIAPTKLFPRPTCMLVSALLHKDLANNRAWVTNKLGWYLYVYKFHDRWYCIFMQLLWNNS